MLKELVRELSSKVDGIIEPSDFGWSEEDQIFLENFCLYKEFDEEKLLAAKPHLDRCLNCIQSKSFSPPPRYLIDMQKALSAVVEAVLGELLTAGVGRVDFEALWVEYKNTLSQADDDVLACLGLTVLQAIHDSEEGFKLVGWDADVRRERFQSFYGENKLLLRAIGEQLKSHLLGNPDSLSPDKLQPLLWMVKTDFYRVEHTNGMKQNFVAVIPEAQRKLKERMDEFKRRLESGEAAVDGFVMVTKEEADDFVMVTKEDAAADTIPDLAAQKQKAEVPSVITGVNEVVLESDAGLEDRVKPWFLSGADAQSREALEQEFAGLQDGVVFSDPLSSLCSCCVGFIKNNFSALPSSRQELEEVLTDNEGKRIDLFNVMIHSAQAVDFLLHLGLVSDDFVIKSGELVNCIDGLHEEEGVSISLVAVLISNVVCVMREAVSSRIDPSLAIQSGVSVSGLFGGSHPPVAAGHVVAPSNSS